MIDGTGLRGVRDRVLMLKSLHTLKDLQDEELSILAERMRLRRFETNDVIFEETDTIDSVFIVLEGAVRIERGGNYLGTMDRGRAAGLLAVLAGDNRGVLATVLEPTVTFELAVPVLMRALTRFPTLLGRFIRIIAGTLLASRGELPRQGPSEWRDSEQRLLRPRTLAERMLLVRRSSGFFSDANLAAVYEVARRDAEVHLSAGEHLWDRGDPATAAFVIDFGRVKCTADDGTVATVASPYLLGDLEALASLPRPYAAVAETDVTLLRIERETFIAVVESHSDIGLTMLSRHSSELLEIGWATLGYPGMAPGRKD